MTYDDLFKLMQSRASVREFAATPVEKDKLLALVEAGRTAPTARNRSLTLFTAVNSAAKVQELAQAMGKALGAEEYNLYNAPAAILISTPRDNNSGPGEIGLASQNILLAAQTLGLGACWVNQLRDTCDDAGVRTVLDQLGIPSDHILINTLVCGIPVSQPEAKEKTTQVNYVE
ncbi:NADPH-flavin oxidoreductase [Actinobaculum suis]|uniref:NADPH-flavin oxidoreductase n=1 Tax=Actinobaculum suis TaxID=1657 RepID=A0A7Z9C8K7_9ACTO|nr:nitroreductase family protein [Actinobaculum suis]VDG75289.1 NADPH-flavin oxidoreductase [Actinobaculum suis]